MTYEEYMRQYTHPGMTHVPFDGSNYGGLFGDYVRDVFAGNVAEEGMRRYGDAVRAAIAGDYGLFGDVLGDAVGGGFLLSTGKKTAARIANELKREKAWEELAEKSKNAGKKRTKTGQYVGFLPGVTSPQKKTAIVKKYADRAQRAVDAGIDPDYFYRAGSDELARITDSPAEHLMVADLYGPTSTQVGPYENTGYAIRALDQNAMGVPVSVGMYPQNLRPKIDAILANENPWQGYKTDRYSFLLGPRNQNVHPLENLPPNDQWEGFGTMTSKQGMVPSGTTNVAAADYVRDQAANRINKDRISQGLPPLSREQIQALHWAAIRAEYSGKPLRLTDKDTLQGSLPYFRYQHSWEPEPGPGTGLLRMSPKEDYAEAMARGLLDPGGKDKLIRTYGGRLQEQVTPGVGVYEGVASPGYQSHSYVGNTAAHGVNDASMARIQGTEATRQYMLGQEMRGGHLFTSGGPVKNRNALEIKADGPPDEATTRMIQGALDEATGGSAGVVFTPDGYRIINFGKMPNKEFQTALRGLGLKGDFGQAQTMSETFDWAGGNATQGLLDVLDNPQYPGLIKHADSPETRQIAGDIAKIYRDLEAQGMLSGSHKLSRALEAWQTQGVDGLRDLVKQGLAPALLLGVVGSQLQTDAPEPIL